jgi:general stress protein 26
MDVASFTEIEPEFMERVARIAWCTVATVDRKGRPRTRILHPIWQETTGWILTGRHTLKTKHLARVPYVSLTYWDPKHEIVYVEAAAAWDDRPEEKRRIWDLYKSTPPPLGYDPAIIWKGPDDPTLGLLKLTPSRIELSDLMGRRKTWRAT